MKLPFSHHFLQDPCGGCFSFAINTMLMQRAYIHSGGAIDETPGAFYTLGCDRTCLPGVDGYCNGLNIGGMPYTVLRNMTEGIGSLGFVSRECFDRQPTRGCPEITAEPFCPSQCANGDPISAHQHWIKGSRQLHTEAEIIADLTTYGSVVMTFFVFEDFMYYRSGIYEYTFGDLAGGHVVTIIGYGTEVVQTGESVDYWLVQNSWGPDYGEGGYFKIRRGNAGSNADVWAGYFESDFVPSVYPTCEYRMQEIMNFLHDGEVIPGACVPVTEGVLPFCAGVEGSFCRYWPLWIQNWVSFIMYSSVQEWKLSEKCQNATRDFACSTLFAPCNLTGGTRLPCRSACESFANECDGELAGSMDCSRYPVGGNCWTYLHSETYFPTKKRSSATGIIVAVVVSVVLGAAILIGCCCYCRMRKGVLAPVHASNAQMVANPMAQSVNNLG